MLDQPQGIPGSELTGPWPVGQYAARLRERLREFARVQVFGEVFGFKAGRAKVWFELRDAGGALPCSMWREDFDALGIAALRDGAQVVAAGGCDYYPGSRTASPSFSFAVTELRVAGEGDLLAQLEQLRRRLYGEGLFEPQKALARPLVPRCIGVVTGETGKARDDVLAGLRRRGWGGRVVWAFAPVQDRHAAPAVTRSLQDLAACASVDVVIVARGGGSLADLFAFCDETLCRTVALLRVPVIASVGHHTDRTLLDDVAAVACSTPTHAAEAAVPLDCAAARAALARAGARLQREDRRVGAARVATARATATMRREARRASAARAATAQAAARLGREGRRVPAARASLAAATTRLERLGRRAVLERARTLAQVSRAPAHHIARHRTRLHQLLRELRAVSRRAVAEGARASGAHASSLARKARATQGRVERAAVPAPALERAAGAAVERRRRELERLLATLDAHDPQRTLERGYALVEDAAGEPVTSAAAAQALPALAIRLHDGRVDVQPTPTRTDRLTPSRNG
jgi:exodeoxyribonuclease VII large subunit